MHLSSLGPPLILGVMLVQLGCAPGAGGGMGGSPDPEPGQADAGCAPVPGEYTGAWTLDVEVSDDDCPAIEPTSSRFGEGADADCSAGCSCTRSVAEEDNVCVGVLTEACTEGAETTRLACALAVEGGATAFAGRCGFEFAEDGDVYLDCRYDVAFDRTGD